MTTETMMTLETIAPAWLEAKIDADAARRTLKSRKSAVESMQVTNSRHADEVFEKQRTGSGTLLTAGQVARRGNGSGVETIYTRCSCEGFPDPCPHDPLESPYSAEIIEAGRAAILKAEKAVNAAEKKLDDTPASFDCFAAARAEKARYVWWPENQRRDPRLYRHRGQIVTQTELDGLGPHGLRNAIAAGGILEVK